MPQASLLDYYNPGSDINKGDIVNGQYYYKNPNLYNPVPVATVPGAQLKPDKTAMRMSDLTQGFVNTYPYFQQAAMGGIVPTAQATLAAQQATAPGLNELMLQLYKQYGPQLNQVGSDIARQNQTNQASTDAAVMAGPGRDVVSNALELAKMYDPEYFSTRDVTANRIGDLLRSIQLGGALSGSERAEISRAQAQEGARRGNYNAPSNLDTVANAMQFGQAGRNREIQNQNQLGQAIQASTAFLPASRTGFDTFTAATGKGQTANTGESKFAGIQTPDTSTSAGLASNFLNATTGLKTNELQIAANKKDWLDQFSQFTGGLGSAVGAVGGAMMCWVAREVYGENNPKWMQFRQWLILNAPTKLLAWYMKNGERFAKKISNKPNIKHAIRNWMDSKIGA